MHCVNTNICGQQSCGYCATRKVVLRIAIIIELVLRIGGGHCAEHSLEGDPQVRGVWRVLWSLHIGCVWRVGAATAAEETYSTEADPDPVLAEAVRPVVIHLKFTAHTCSEPTEAAMEVQDVLLAMPSTLNADEEECGGSFTLAPRQTYLPQAMHREHWSST